MTGLLIIVLIISTLGFISVVYAVRNAWDDYTLAAKHNGWVLLSARAILRAQFLRLVTGGLLTTTLALGLIFPMETRPGYITLLLRLSILGAIILIAVNAILDALTRRKVLQAD